MEKMDKGIFWTRGGDNSDHRKFDGSLTAQKDEAGRWGGKSGRWKEKMQASFKGHRAKAHNLGRWGSP